MTSVDSGPAEVHRAQHREDVAMADMPISLSVNTTQGSFIHALLPQRGRGAWVAKVYLLAVLCTYLPILLSAVLGPGPILERTASLRLPFLRDWNVAFMFLVSFPALLVLTVTDQKVLNSALRQVQRDGVLIVDARAASLLSTKWHKRFRRINRSGYIVGAIAGSLLAGFNYVAYVPADVGYWVARQSRMVPAGYAFLVGVFAFYGVMPIYIFRNVAISLFLRDLVTHCELRLLPFHPDRCGGIRPVGELGLRSQYALTVLGLNVISLVAISFFYLHVPPWLYGLIVAAAIGYALLGPVVFMGPLLPFRAGMLRTKTELMGEVAQRLRIELQRLRKQLPAGQITREDEELIERLRKLGAVIDELPVWPFDAGTLKRFLTAYVIPMVGAVGYPVVQLVIGRLMHP